MRFTARGSSISGKNKKEYVPNGKKIVEENDTCDFGKPPYPIANVTIRALDKAVENLEALEGLFNKACF